MAFELFSHMTFVIASQLAEVFFKHPSQGLLQHVVSKYKEEGQDRGRGGCAEEGFTRWGGQVSGQPSPEGRESCKGPGGPVTSPCGLSRK